MEKPLVIAFSADEKYAYATSVAIWSVINTTRHPVEFHVIDNNIGSKSKELISRVVSRSDCSTVVFHQLPDRLKSADDIPGPVKGTLARLLIPQLIPDAPRVLYLDGDVLVLKDISALCSIDLEGAPIGVIKNLRTLEKHYVSNSRLARFFRRTAAAARKERARMLRDVGCINLDRYINAGVFLLDINAILSDRERLGRFMDFRSAFSKSVLDQDWIFYVFHQKMKYLHPKWNSYSSIGRSHLWAFDSHERKQFLVV